MAGDGEIIGGIGLEVFASYDGLQADIDTAVGMVQGGSDKMAEAVDSAFAGPTSNGITAAAEETSNSLQNLASAAGEAGPPINSLDELLKQLVDSGQTLQEALQTAALSQFSSDAQDLAATMGIVVTNATEAADQISEIGSSAAGAGSDAAAAAEQLSLFDEAVQVPYAEAAGQLNMFATELEPIAGAAKTATEEAVDLGDKIAQTGENATKAAEGIHKAGEEAEHAGSKAHDAAHGGFEHLATELLEFAGIELSLHALKELGEFAMEASDGFTQATISLTALTGSSEEARQTLEHLEELGQKDGMAMPALETAATRLTALLPPGTDVVSVLGKIADGAAAMHTSIETAAQKFAIITENGNASAKALAGFGLTTGDLKDAMEQLGLSADTNFKKLDQHDRVIIMEEALGKLKGTAEDVANNTFGGMWTKMANQFEATMVQAGDAVKPFAQTVMPMLGTALKGIVAAFAEVIFAVKETVDVVVGMVATLVAGFTGLGDITQKLLSGDLKGAAQSAKDTWTNMGAAISHTWDDMKADAKTTGDFLDNLGKKSTEAGEKSEGMGEKLHGVTLTLKDHQDAIKKLAESDLPAAIMAQQKFAEQMAASGAPIQSAANAYADMGKLVDKLAKENLPAAMDAQQGMINSMIATDQPAGAVAEAYAHIQSFIQKLAKEDIPAAVEAQNHFIDSLIATDQPASAVRLAFEEQQKLIQALAKQDLPDAIAEQQQYIESLKDTDQPLTMVLAAYKEQQTLIKQMATEDLPLAIDLQGQLIDELSNTEAPAETVRAAYSEQEKMLKALAVEDLPAAIQKQQELIDKMRDTEQPVNDVRRVFQDMEAEIKALSQTDIPAAIQQQQYLIDKLIATKQPAEDVRRAFEDEQRIIQQLAREDIQEAINKQQALIDKMIATKQPAQDVISAYQGQQKLINQLAQTDLPNAINQQQALIDKLIATHQPAQVVQQAFQQMQGDISTLANTSLPAAISAQQGMIDKLIATNQPLQLVVKAFQDEQGMIAKMAQTDIPAAITAQQNLIDKLTATQQPALEVQKAYDGMRGIISTMAQTDLPGAIDKLQAFTQKTIDAHGPAQDLAKDFSQQSSFISQLAKIDLPAAIEKQAEYIQQMKDAGRPLSDVLKAQTDIDKMEIQLSLDRGTSASKWIIDLENIKQKQADVADSAVNILGNSYKILMKTWNDAWEAVGHTLTDQLVVIDKTDSAWTKMLKGIEKEILDGLIGVALKALRSEVDSLITSLIPSLGDAFKGVAGGISGAFTPAMNAASSAAQTAAVNAATLGANAAAAAPNVAALGSGAASAGSAASSVGGAFGSFGASLSVVSGAVSAVSGVIGNFQMAAMNATMSLVEVNTRITALVTQKELPIISATGVQEELTLNSIWASILDTATHQYDRLGDIWGQLREIQQHIDMTTDEVNGMRFGVNAVAPKPAADSGPAEVLVIGASLEALKGIWSDENLIVQGLQNINLELQHIAQLTAGGSEQATQDFKNLFATGSHIGDTLVGLDGSTKKLVDGTWQVVEQTKAQSDALKQSTLLQQQSADAQQKVLQLTDAFQVAQAQAQAAVQQAMRDGTQASMEAATKAQSNAASLYAQLQQAQKTADELNTKASAAQDALQKTETNTATTAAAIKDTTAAITETGKTSVEVASSVERSGKNTTDALANLQTAAQQNAADISHAVTGPTETSAAVSSSAQATSEAIQKVDTTMGEVSVSLSAIELATASLVDIELIRQGVINLNLSLQQVYADVEMVDRTIHQLIEIAAATEVCAQHSELLLQQLNDQIRNLLEVARAVESSSERTEASLQALQTWLKDLVDLGHASALSGDRVEARLQEITGDVADMSQKVAALAGMLTSIDASTQQVTAQLKDIAEWGSEAAQHLTQIQTDASAILDALTSHLVSITTALTEIGTAVNLIQGDVKAIAAVSADILKAVSGTLIGELQTGIIATAVGVISKTCTDLLTDSDQLVKDSADNTKSISDIATAIATVTAALVQQSADGGQSVSAIDELISMTSELTSILGDLQTRGTDDTPGMSVIDAVVVMTKAAVSIDESLKTNAAEGGTKTAAEYLKELLDVNTSGLNRVVQAINEQMGKLITTFNEKFVAGFDKVVTALDTDSGNIVTAISEAASAIVAGVSGAVSGLGSMISAAIGAVGSAVSSLAGAIGGAITTLNSQITTVATGLSNLSAREASDVTNLQAAIAAIPPPLGMDDIQNAISAALSGAGGGNNAPSSNNAGTGSEMSPGYQAGQSGGHYANDGTWIPDRYVPSSNALASYDLGGYVPKDMIANLHAGEFVLSPDIVKSLGGVSSVQQIFMPSGLGAPAVPGYAPTVGAAGAAGMAGNGAGSHDTFLFNFYGSNNVREQAEQLINHLRTMSPKFKTLSVI